ncbi:xylulokinase [Parashewanella tropica]|uniref:xylulokinase n=1 Tax=Parashewanella tropica TaxID=2547970 RepID=UPI001059A105|nr:xylulokinase [Parashewanella tropica]
MYLGIDLGTSGVKSIVIDKDGEILASHISTLTVSRPHELWSEQNPQDWWNATELSIQGLSQQVDLSHVKAIGLSGQMHGATLLSKNGRTLRPAMLWNDGRSAVECAQLEHKVPNCHDITGNLIMPGFTAPKVKWVANHEPYVFSQIDKVLLPKDYLRFKMTGNFATDLSDASGTAWLDVKQRKWDQELLKATGLSEHQMPELFEGTQITGNLLPEIANKWGMPTVSIVAGGGDNAAGAIGMGIIHPKQAMLSLGTSGVYFSVSEGYVSKPETALHSFCHALPETWHTMSVMLSAASCLNWVANLVGFSNVPSMITAIEKSSNRNSEVMFLPYLSGERTPHNDPKAKGVFFGITHSTNKVDLAQAVLEGVGFALADGLDTVHSVSAIPDEISLIGGGAKSQYWRQLLTDIFGLPLVYRQGGDIGPALGAARLAQLGVRSAENLKQICPVPALIETHIPDIEQHHIFKQKRVKFQKLYTHLKGLF